MCGRFGFDIPRPRLTEHFGLAEAPEELAARYNVAPTQRVAAVRAAGAGRELFFPRWGLVPHWAKNERAGAKMINARAETAADKPAFRAAMRARRCVIPASGFYEWRRAADGGRQPHWIRLRGGEPMGLAGLWEARRDPDGGPELVTCAILTVAANALVARLHDRMPAILPPGDYGAWLESGEGAPGELLRPYDAGAMEHWAVSARVNSVSNEGPDLMRPVAVQGGLPL